LRKTWISEWIVLESTALDIVHFGYLRELWS
jgi:hypothetical protein